MARRIVKVRGTEHRTAHEALVALNFGGDHAISLAGRFFTVTHRELNRLQVAGWMPATWHDLRGRIVSVPGRHG